MSWHFISSFRKLIAVILLAATFLAPGLAEASLNLIRDAEIESLLREYLDPLLTSAGIPPESVNIYIINNNSINAFVSGGSNIYFHTGLLVRTEHPGQLMGVMAHEIGHIAGAHLSKAYDRIDDATAISIVSTILGTAAGVASGNAGLAGAISAGGQGIAQRSFLSFSRSQEQAADQIGLNLLEENQISPKGQLEILEKIKQLENWLGGQQNEYLRSHPITTDRINFIKHNLASSPYSDRTFLPSLQLRHERMLGKLQGFLGKPKEVINNTSADDNTVLTRYARAIAFFRNSQLDKALAVVDNLLKDFPNDPYFTELKAQMYFENSRIPESIRYYRKAVELAPNEPLLKLSLGRALLQTENPEHHKQAIGLLKDVVQTNRRNAFAWKQLGIAQGRTGLSGEAALSLAEVANISGNEELKRQQAEKASSLLPYGSPGWLRAQDLLLETKKK